MGHPNDSSGGSAGPPSNGFPPSGSSGPGSLGPGPDLLDPKSIERAIARQRLRRRLSFLGCGCFVVLAVCAVVFAVVVYQGAKNLAADFSNPEARTQKVLAALGAESLPPGYHAVMAVDVPLPFDMVVLSDEPWLLEPDADPATPTSLPTFNGVPGSKLFYYIHIQAEDRTGNDPFEREFKSQEKLDQGDLQIHDRRVAWEAHRGQGLRPQGHQEGIFCRLRFECDDQQTRRAVWFHERSPSDSTTGTPADPEAISAFLGHFRVCGEPEEPEASDP